MISLVKLSVLTLVIKLKGCSREGVAGMSTSIFVCFVSLFVVVTSVRRAKVLREVNRFLRLVEGPLTLVLMFSLAMVLVAKFISTKPSAMTFFPVMGIVRSDFPRGVTVAYFYLSVYTNSSLFLATTATKPLLAELARGRGLAVRGRRFVFSFGCCLVPKMVKTVIVFFSGVLCVFLGVWQLLGGGVVGSLVRALRGFD